MFVLHELVDNLSGQAAWSTSASHEPSGLFNDTVSSSSNLTSNSRLISETC